MFDTQSIDALNEVLQNFLKFRQFFQVFFLLRSKSVIDCTLLKYQHSAQFGQFLILTKIFKIAVFTTKNVYGVGYR